MARVTALTSRRRQFSRRFTFHKRVFPHLKKIPLNEELQREEEDVGHLSSLFVSTFLFFFFFYLPSLQLHSSPSSLLISFLPRRRRMETLMRFGSRWLDAMHPTTTTSPRSHPPTPFPLNDGAADDILLTRRHRTRRGSSSEPSRGGGGGKKKADSTSSPPYLSQTPSRVGPGGVHLSGGGAPIARF